MKFCSARAMLVIERATATVTGRRGVNVRYPPMLSPVMLAPPAAAPRLLKVPCPVAGWPNLT